MTVTEMEPRQAMRGLKGKNVLVTGGTSGIGQAIAVRFAEYGANVAINYLRRPERGRRTPRSRCTPACTRSARRACTTCSSAATSPTRTTSSRMVDDTVERARRHRRARQQRRHPDLAPLARAVGGRLRQGARGQPARLVPVRPRGDQALPRRGRRRASIVNVSSVHQLIPKPNYLGYSARKGGMQNLTRTLALEYAAQRHPRQRDRPGRDGHADQPRLDRRPGQARDGRGAHPDAARRRPPTRWPASRASSPPTTPPTSPARRSSSTAA